MKTSLPYRIVLGKKTIDGLGIFQLETPDQFQD